MFPIVKRWSTIPTDWKELHKDDLYNSQTGEHLGVNIPALNILERDDRYIVELAAPGLKKENFDVSINNNVLSIVARTGKELEDVSNDYIRQEYEFSTFQRLVNLPVDVDEKDIELDYIDGIYRISIPKA
ncbi:MAG: Hsp20/alpha crystallin family protein [Bacteroidales bacterium]|nr:Hsp20/alpha crystallin family protein [Bacteroidales bacterium]MCF8387331.1 Hsp20/alpha crystallin family protein [Bacteroidales bacterium]MCF8398037.1 Hsp20/alpha crystallin family protein [Bacteroidales bacterium]